MDLAQNAALDTLCALAEAAADAGTRPSTSRPHQAARLPPSTYSTVPVTYDASGDAR